MSIADVQVWRRALPLTRPYTIAYRTIDAVELFFVRLADEDGTVGVGSASPAAFVTGESPERCLAGLEAGRDLLAGGDPRHLGGLLRRLDAPLAAAPAARAALDMALHDLLARRLGVPLADLLGRCHDGLPTSITIGIKSAEEAVAEAAEYAARGFTHLKVKLGKDPDEDAGRLRRLREAVPPATRIRVDANQGYDAQQAGALERLLDDLDIEFAEQPLPAADVAAMRGLPETLHRRIAADESLHGPADAVRLASPPAACGIFNIKLMKCGGIGPALEIGAIARAAGLDLMWGCMDESVISIAAALHAAYASPATRHLDLDGSFDLSEDQATGGFVLKDGRLYLTDEPGLGVQLTGEAGA